MLTSLRIHRNHFNDLVLISLFSPHDRLRPFDSESEVVSGEMRVQITFEQYKVRDLNSLLRKYQTYPTSTCRSDMGLRYGDAHTINDRSDSDRAELGMRCMCFWRGVICSSYVVLRFAGSCFLPCGSPMPHFPYSPVLDDCLSKHMFSRY